MLDLDNICGTRIKVERSRKDGQCHHCELFEHGSDMCHNDVACVHYGKPHPTSACRLASGPDDYCINCGINTRPTTGSALFTNRSIVGKAKQTQPSARNQHNQLCPTAQREPFLLSQGLPANSHIKPPPPVADSIDPEPIVEAIDRTRDPNLPH